MLQPQGHETNAQYNQTLFMIQVIKLTFSSNIIKFYSSQLNCIYIAFSLMYLEVSLESIFILAKLNFA